MAGRKKKRPGTDGHLTVTCLSKPGDASSSEKEEVWSPKHVEVEEADYSPPGAANDDGTPPATRPRPRSWPSVGSLLHPTHQTKTLNFKNNLFQNTYAQHPPPSKILHLVET